MARKIDTGFVVGDQTVERELSSDGRTAAITNLRTGRRVPVESEELKISLGDRALTRADFALAGIDVAEDLVVRLTSTDLDVEVRFSGARKTLFLRSRAELFIEAVDVERLRVEDTVDLGGLGQPFFIGGDLFLALEHPAGHQLRENGALILRHFPGKRAAALMSCTSIIGASESGAVERGFADYVRTIRSRPARSFVVFTGFYDRQGADVTEANMDIELEALNGELVQKRGVRLDAFCVDRGWANLQSVWRHNPRAFPHGLEPFSARCRAAGARLGLWVPLTAYYHADPHLCGLDTHWGAAAGYEIAPNFEFFCVAGPRYRAALKESLADLVTTAGVGYLKHDYNYFFCAAPDHGHATTEDASREAIADALIEIFEHTRALAPDVYITPTSGMWLSPWWLRHCETVWPRHCVDWAYEKKPLAIEPRDWEMTYRDSRIHMNLREDRAQFPLSAIMTLGIIDGRLNRLGGANEPLRKWVDNAMLCMARGTMLKELYLSPDLVTPAQWDALASALHWAESRADVLVEGEMILGDPARGETYGYRHEAAGRTIICLRNPTFEDAVVELDLKLRADQVALVTYPYAEAFQGKLRVPALAVLVIETFSKNELGFDPPPGRFAIAGGELRSLGEPEPAPRAEKKRTWRGELSVTARGLVRPGQLVFVTPSKERATVARDVRYVDGDGWTAAVIELAPGDHEVRAKCSKDTRVYLIHEMHRATRTVSKVNTLPFPPHAFASVDACVMSADR
jgi:hypothetical protein